jgi:hypothetical protein
MFSSKTASTLNKRREKLTTFLEGILAADKLRKSEEFKVFLSVANAGAAGPTGGERSSRTDLNAGVHQGEEGSRQGEVRDGKDQPSADLSSDDEGDAGSGYYS